MAPRHSTARCPPEIAHRGPGRGVGSVSGSVLPAAVGAAAPGRGLQILPVVGVGGLQRHGETGACNFDSIFYEP